MPTKCTYCLNIVNEAGKVSNLNTVISRVYVHRRKKLMDEGQRKFGFPFNLGDLLSHTIHLHRLCEPCVFTHTSKGKKKTLTHFVPTHSPRTPPQLCTSSTSITAATLSSTVLLSAGRGRAPNGTGFCPYRFPPPIYIEILDSGRLGFSTGLGQGFFSWRR